MVRVIVVTDSWTQTGRAATRLLVLTCQFTCLLDECNLLMWLLQPRECCALADTNSDIEKRVEP